MRRKRQKLESKQQDLACKYIPMARVMAKEMKLDFPMIGDEFEGECLLALVEAAESFDPKRNVKFSTFARYRINGAIKTLQRNTQKAESVDDYEIEDSSSHFGIEEEEEFKFLIRYLDPRQREVLYYIIVLGFSCREVAKKMNITRSHVKHIYHNAMQFLRQGRIE